MPTIKDSRNFLESEYYRPVVGQFSLHFYQMNASIEKI